MSAVFGADRLRRMEMIMRVVDGIICSTVVHRPPLQLVQRRARGNAATASTSSATSGRSRRARASRSAGPAASGTGSRSRAGSRRCAPSCAPAPRRASCRSGTRRPPSYVEEFGPERAVAYPTAKIEVYPASMTLFDVAIAPSAENNQFRGKSDLRWLEASAVGIPLVAHPEVYPDIEDGVTGVHASTPAEVEAALLRLIDDADERERIGAHRPRARGRAPPHRGHGRAAGARCSTRSARPRSRPDRKLLQVRPKLPNTSVSHGRRQQEPYRASPPPPLSQFEVHRVAGGRPTHTPPRDGSRGRPLRRPPVCVNRPS